MHVVGFSGGVASAVAAKIIYDKHPTNTVLLFHDTKTEPDDNDRFRCEVSDYIGCPVTEDSDGRDIWGVFDDCGYLGNGRNTPCSRILKQERSLAWLQCHPGAALYIGFTSEESGRAQRTWARYQKHDIDVGFPLIEAGLSKRDCWRRVTECWEIKPPQMYEWADHANCVPCVKGKKAYWGLIHTYDRAAWERAADAEDHFGHTIFTEAGSLRDELNNCLRLAGDYMKKRGAAESQGELFDAPCECMM
jgi:hypothetical protein